MSGAAGALARVYPLLQGGRFAEAEQALRAIAAQSPPDAEAHFLLGMCRHQLGAGADVLGPLRKAVALAPDAVQYAVNLGVVLAERRELDEAEQVLRSVLARAPRDPAAHNALGVTLHQAGRLAEALDVFARGAALAPRDDGVRNNYGRTLRDAGRAQEALVEIRAALALNPGNVMALLNLGNALRDTGALPEAIAAFERAIAAAPGFSMALHNLGEALLDAGRPHEALQAFARAMRAAPAVGAHCQRYVDTVGQLAGDAPDALDRTLVAQCVARDDVDLGGIAAAAFGLLAQEPPVAALLAAAESQEAFAVRFATAEAHAALSDPLLLGLIARTVVPERRAERLLTAFRRAALERWGAGIRAEEARRWIAPLAALALQCFQNEYAYAMDETEQVRVAEVADRVAGAALSAADAPAMLALLACYRPLRGNENAAAIARSAADPWLERLVRRQVTEPAEEARLAASIPTLTPIADAVSLAVRAQYEENPYPRWAAAPGMAGAQPLQQKLCSLFPFLSAADAAVPDHPRLLVAGCGTGRQVALAAMLHPSARVLAIDLSRASLAYAARRAAELGLANVRFAQADILELGALEERFDIIDCAGVLHHLRDPLAGWRVLRRLLAGKGFMRIALYSELGRAAVVAARELIAAEGFGADPEGIRRARQRLLALPDGHPALPVTATLDFWSTSGCRDLLFHVQEHRFTLTAIGAALAGLELDFLGFELGESGVRQAYLAEFPDDVHARSLASWAAFEARHPDTFGGMYQFWARAGAGAT